MRFRTAIACLAVMTFACGAYAAAPQDESPATETPKEESPAIRIQAWFDTVAEKLALTDDQRKEMAEILTAHIKKLKDVVPQYESAKGSEKRAAIRQVREMRTELDDKLRAVLSAEQMNTFNAMRDEMRQQMRENKEKRDGSALPESFVLK